MNFFYSLFTLHLVSIFLVTFQFIPIPRYLQTSVLFNNSKWYFFGGIIGNNVDTNKTNEVVYLSLSSSFDTSSPLWNNSQIGSPLANALSSSFISIDMSSIFLIGGVYGRSKNTKLCIISVSI